MKENTIQSPLFWNLYRRVSFALLLALPLLVFGCKKDESMAATYYNPNSNILAGGYLTFYGTVDSALNSSCGTATVKTSSSTSSTGTTTGTTSSTSTGTTGSTYTIVTYLIFEVGKSAYTFNYPTSRVTINMRYEYNSARKTYSLTPGTTTTQICSTSDLKTCNSAGAYTCSTTDNVNCLLDSYFTFTNVNTATNPALQTPGVNFSAYSGSFDWSKGFALNTTKTAVTKANLKFNMSAADGTLLTGEVDCNINAN